MFEDLRRYKDATDDARRKALDDLAADAQELRMGYCTMHLSPLPVDKANG